MSPPPPFPLVEIRLIQVSIKLVPFCIQKFFKLAFAFVKVFWVFVLSLPLMIDENAIDVDGLH